MAESSKFYKPLLPKVIEVETHLEFQLLETDSLDVVKEQARHIVVVCLEKKPRRVLVDLSAVSGKVRTLDRYDLGMIASKVASTVERMALVAQARLVDPEKFGLRVAQNRGLKGDLFVDRDAALAWLLA